MKKNALHVSPGLILAVLACFLVKSPAVHGRIPEDLAARLLERHPGTSALALAVIREGRTTAVQFAGVEGKSGSRVGPETVFRTCSLSKPVFAYLVMKKAEQGLLGLDQALIDVLGGRESSLKDYSDVASDPRFKLLTARVILTHRGGFPNWRWQEPDGRLRFKFEPGSSFSYSGEGYRFLQAVIEGAAGRHLDDLAAEELFSPLKMRTASFLLTDPLRPRLSFDVTAIPPFFQEQMARERNAAGSLLCTIGDYAGFMEALIAGRGLSDRSRSEMLKPAVKMTSKALFGPQAGEPGGWAEDAEASWCLGWIHIRSSLGECYFHVGAEEGFENFAVFFPEQGAGLVIFSSGPSPAGVARDAVENVFGVTGIPFAWMGYEQLGDGLSSSDREEAKREILDLHRKMIAAHLNNDAGHFSGRLADGFLSVKNGEILRPTPAEVEAGLETYLRQTRFSEYRDLQEPVVGFSRDGSVAWSVAQVRVRGVRTLEDGSTRDVDFVCAWLTLYERSGRDWKTLAEVSTFK